MPKQSIMDALSPAGVGSGNSEKIGLR